MDVLITDRKGNPLRTEQRTPRCHEDFCDRCGDCLSCADVGEECFGMSVPDGTGHFWTMTEEELAAFDAEQAAPQPVAA